MLSIGAPISIQQSTTSLGFVVMMSLVPRFGSAVTAAYGICIRIIDIMQAFTMGLMRATSTLVGQYIGAELYERARSKSITNFRCSFAEHRDGAAHNFSRTAILVLCERSKRDQHR